MLLARPGALGEPDVIESLSLVQRGLHGGPADPCERPNLVDRKVAIAVVFDLTRDDAENRALAFGVIVAQRVRQST